VGSKNQSGIFFSKLAKVEKREAALLATIQLFASYWGLGV